MMQAAVKVDKRCVKCADEKFIGPYTGTKREQILTGVGRDLDTLLLLVVSVNWSLKATRGVMPLSRVYGVAGCLERPGVIAEKWGVPFECDPR